MKSTKALTTLCLVVMLCSPVFMSEAYANAATQAPTSLSIGEVATPPIGALNPFNPSSDYNVLGILYDYMFSLNWPPLPYITDVMAGGYSSNTAATQYNISLRPNLEWSNGSPLNSTDLAFTLKLYNESGDFTPAITKMTILNSTTVQLNLANASSNFIYVGFIANGFAVLPYQTFSKVAFADLGSFPNLNNIVADGPFVFSNYTGQNPIVFNANPHYWNGAPKLQSMEWYMYSSQSSMFDAYVANQIDALPYPGAYTGLQSIASLAGHTLVGPPTATPALTVGAYLNDWVYPTNMSAFRLALAYGTNASQINHELNGPYANGSVSNQDFLIPSYNLQIGFGNSTGAIGYSYNVTMAKQILRSSGFKYSGNTLQYPNGTAVALTIKYRTTEPYAASVATLLDTSWSQLGIAVTPVSVPSATLRAGANNPSGWQVLATGVLGPQTNDGVTPGPGVLADLGDYYVLENGTHVSWNSTYYTLNQKLANDPANSSQFNTDARAAATMLAKDVPIIPLFNVDNWLAVSNNFYWGSASNSTGIYYPQAITQLVYWDLSLDTIAPLTASSSSLTSTTTPSSASSGPGPSSTATTTSATTPSSSSSTTSTPASSASSAQSTSSSSTQASSTSLPVSYLLIVAVQVTLILSAALIGLERNRKRI